MATFDTHGISLYYETHGSPQAPPVMLIAGLGGAGTSWGAHVARFAERHHVILPDQRGTGKTSRAADGYTVAQLATDLASLLAHLGTGPAHVVGSSTGGAIGQLMALEHPEVVGSLTLSSSFARADAFVRREFALRRKLVAEADPRTIYDAYATFLFSPLFTRTHPERVAAWVERVAAFPLEREIALQRIDMIMAHDTVSRLGDITVPTLALVGDHDFCVPPALTDELVRGIPGAKRVVLPGGHMIHDEEETLYFEVVRSFLDGNPLHR